MFRTTQVIIALGATITMFLSTADSRAAIVLATAGVAVVEDFDSYRGLGFSATPNAGQLDSNTYRAMGFSSGDGTFGGEFTTLDFARGTSAGGVSTGGAYAFEVAAGDYAMGVQPTDDDFTPGTLTIRILNQTGVTLTHLDVTADALLYNDQDRSTLWSFQGSLVDLDPTYTTFRTLQSPQAADSSPAWSSQSVGGVISLGPGVADGGEIFIRVLGADAGGSGSRDEFALNNFSITGITAIPEPSSVAVLIVLLGGAALVRRGRRTVSLTGNSN